MELEEYPSVSLHNVAETEPADWTSDGDRLCRVPESYRPGLNEDARERVRHPTGSELRFVPEDDDAEIEVTLSAAEPTEIRTFWGDFQPWKPTDLGTEPRTFTLSVPERLPKLRTDDTGRFDPRVCRILFERVPAIAVHDVSGPCRPPREDELPDTRYLAYGTSITEGAAAEAPHLDYVTHLSRELGYDALNHGCSGSAYCDAPMAEFIASRDDWDVATLAMSVNMAMAEFSVEAFHDRAEYFVDEIASAHPEKPIVCVTLFTYFADVVEGGPEERAREFRSAVREIVEDLPHSNVHVVDGRELADVPGMTADVLHPGDAGMITIGRRLARRVDEIVEG